MPTCDGLPAPPSPPRISAHGAPPCWPSAAWRPRRCPSPRPDARRRPPAPWRRCATRWRAKWLRPWAIRRRYAARPISIRGSSRHGRRAAWAGPRRVRAGRASGNGPPAASCAARSGPRSPAADDRDAQQAARPRVTIRPGIRDTDGIMRLRVVFGLVLLALACAAPAQQLPRPAEFYFDEDERIARPLVAVEG